MPSWGDSRSNEALEVQRWAFWWKALGVVILTSKRHLLGTTAEKALCLFTLPDATQKGPELHTYSYFSPSALESVKHNCTVKDFAQTD